MLLFDEQYPKTPPICTFLPRIFHPNVFPSGRVALSLIEEDWKPTLTIRDVLLGIQLLLNDPNVSNPANAEAYTLFMDSQECYIDHIRDQAFDFTIALYAESDDS